jgi:serine/threonine-protein kinase 11
MSLISGGKPLSLGALIPEKLEVRMRSSRIHKVNDYVLRAKLGSGASSRVYLGIDSNTNQRYAVKRVKLRELCRSSSGVAQLEREIRLMRTMSSPNIIKLKEVLLIESDQEAFLILEYAENGSLGAYIDRGQRISFISICSIIKQVVSAIKYLHTMGFVHQDIKPWNILVGTNGRMILADFGIGHSFQSAAMVVGSPAYQAPEALDDYSDGEEEVECQPQKEDIWGLGVTLYQLLYMRLPFPGENLYEIVNYIKENGLQVPEGTDPLMAELLAGMLKTLPAERYGTDAVLNNPLIKNAPDLAPDLPDVEPPILLDGPIVECPATVCPPGYSFANVAQTIQEKLMAINAPYSPVFMSERSFPRTIPQIHESESSDDDDLIGELPLRK